MEVYRFTYRCQECGSDTQLRYVVPEEKSWITLSCKTCEAQILSILKFPATEDSPAAFRVRDETRDRLLFTGELAYEQQFLGWIRDHGGDRRDE